MFRVNSGEPGLTILVPEQDIEPPPSFGSQIPTDFLIGMGKLDTRLVMLLDIGRVLSLDDLQLLAGRELPESA